MIDRLITYIFSSTCPLRLAALTIASFLILTLIPASAQNENPRPMVLFDENGVPSVWYEGWGYQRNPVTIANYGMEFYERNQANPDDKMAIVYFVNHVDWLVNNTVKYNEITGFLPYHFDFGYNMTAPWYSAMANGLAIEALTKAYQVTGNQTYLDTAKLLMYGLMIPVEKGGVTIKSDDAGWWYEEYADIGGANPRVLNGMMYTLRGLYYYYNVTGDKEAKYFFDIGTISLENNLPLYDPDTPNTYSYYDVYKTGAGEYYNNIHVKYLNEFYEITGIQTFKHYADKWAIIEPNLQTN